jgi:hypothetical protein
VGKNFAVLDIFFMEYIKDGKVLAHLLPNQQGFKISTLIFEKKNVEGVFINIP